MSTRLTVDTNFFYAFGNWPDEARKQAISRYRNRGALEFFLSLESLEESVGLYYDEAKLRARARVVLEFLGGRLLARPEDIVDSELRGQAQPLETAQSVEAVRAVFQQIVDGHVPRSARRIADRARKMKLDVVAYYRDMQDKLRSQVPKRLLDGLATTSYTEFHTRYWGKHRESYLRRLAAERGLDDPDEVAQRIMASPDRFPYTTALMTLISRLLYRYLVANRRIDEGDAYDVRQVLYLVGLDVLVTEDRKVQAMVGELHGPSKRAMTVEAFMAEPWDGSPAAP